MSAVPAVAVAVTFVWLGMVAAISFLEAPLKFRAPNVTRSHAHYAYVGFEAIKVIALVVAGILLPAS